jgi:alkanesulfonate monooxygenase SsuD/methylene tetrahydromethanopterin reductase-like flavin-dependent oxidoreductase (luciferase family)
MAERLGLGLIPLGWSAREIQAVAREAEAAGFDAIFTAEVNNNALAVAQLMGTATTRIQVGTWIANMYMRHSYACAQGAALISDATEGRFILGLGMSHQPVNQGLGIEMSAPAQTLRQYVIDVRMWLRGEGPTTHVPQQPAAQPVPLYLAALASTAVELGGELADGLMPFLWTAERVAKSQVWADRGRAKASGLGALDMTLGLPTFIGDDMDNMREAARQNLGLFTTFPFFQRLFRVSGFEEEAERMEQGQVGPDSLTDRILDATCLLGPVERCQEQLSAFRGSGVDMPILMPPLGVESVRAVIQAFRR